MRRGLGVVFAVIPIWGLFAGTALSAAVDQDGDGVAAGDCAALNPAIYPGAADLPDLAFRDTNCDGIDGDSATAWFVAPDGNDSNVGTKDQPFQTLQKAVVSAASTAGRKEIYAAVGTYGRTTIPPEADGVGIFGGYQRGPWTRTSSTPTTIAGAPEALLLNGAVDVVVQLVTLTSSPDGSRSAYGIRAYGGSEIALSRTRVQPGDGAAGATGGGGSTPAKPSAAANGGNGQCNSAGGGGNDPALIGHARGGTGGAGGEETTDGENGINGSAGAGNPLGWGLGGPGGTSRHVDSGWDPSLNGGSGGTGRSGSPGANAGGGSNALTAAGIQWAGFSGGTGGMGGDGGAGGGGGGGAGTGSMTRWAAGAGGGQGGHGGRGGTGGAGGFWGGGSFGIYLHNATAVVTDASSVSAGDGGPGGNGGAGGGGGAGGNGGFGGSPSNSCNGVIAGVGGAGGAGGSGGPGGHGGGGAGGPSAAIFRGSASAFATVHEGSTVTAGAAGAGGAGGTGGTGANGQAGEVLGATAATVGDFDADGLTDASDTCAALERGTADVNGDGCPDAPATTLGRGPAHGSFALTNAARFSLSSSETSSTFTCSLNNGAGIACTSPRSYSALGQKTHVLRVWARDAAGTPDESPATRRWTVPVNNTALTHSTGWTKKTGSGYYLGSFSTTTRKGAALTRNASGLRKIALVATRGPNFGKVRVFLGSTLLKEIGLGSSTLRKKQLISVASFGTAKSGTVRVVVVSSGKTVRVEGLGLATG